MIGTEINGRYTIETELGRGGMGVVYKANDLLLKRVVALKVVEPSVLGTEGRTRLLREAQAAAALNQPNIVAVYDAGETELPGHEGRSAFVVMEFVQGQTLREYQPATIFESISILQQVCAALEAAHAQGIIHRDLKAENVIRTEQGLVKLMDFGLARTLDRTRLTQEGTFIGTFDYMAPEIIQGYEATAQSDLYALGVLAYELLAGRRPFAADTPAAILAQHLNAPPTPPSAFNQEISPALESLVTRLLSKRPDDRPVSAAAVAEILVDITERGNDRAVPIIGPRVDLLVRGRLVGREKELSEGMSVWQQAAGGRLRVLLISGEPGIGKTRLGTEIAVQAQLTGARVLQGQCYEHGGLPFMPVAQMVRDALHSNDLPDLPPAVPVALSRLVPDLDPERWAAAQVEPAADEDQEEQLLESLVLLCQLLARERPLLLAFDDLHWADSGTMGVIRHLARRLDRAPVMIMATYREVELGGRRSARQLLDDLCREAGAQRLKLSRLDRTGTEALLATLFAEEITAEFLDAIYHETEGNPFFVEELCKSLVESGQLTLEDGRWQRPAMAEIRLPQSIQVAIMNRLERLDNQALEYLQSAAMLGREFGYGLLRAAVQAPEAELVSALDGAMRAQLIAERALSTSGGMREPAFFFTHALIQATLLDDLGMLRRQLLARWLAQAISAAADGQAGLAPLLGRLYSEAGDGRQAVPYLLQAGDEARRLFAFEEAVELYEQALLNLRQEGDLDGTARVLLALGASAMKAGLFEHSSRAYDEAFALWRRAPRTQNIGNRDTPGRTYRTTGMNPVSLDPLHIQDSLSCYYLNQLFESLIELGPDDEILPAAASSWQIQEGGRRYLFYLRQDAQWNDGVPVTAADFEFTWKRILSQGHESQAAYLLFDIQGARNYHEGLFSDLDSLGIRSVDPLTLVVDLERPVAYFLHMLAELWPAPKHVVEKLGDRWAETPQLVSNGPFCLFSWEPDRGITLTRNEHFNGKSSGNVDRVEITFSRDMSVLDAYVANQLETLNHPLCVSAVNTMAERKFSADLVTFPGVATVYLAFNCGKPPFTDKRVRQAASLVIDRKQLSHPRYSQFRDVAMSGLIPPGIAGHGLGPKPVYDPERARRQLSGAGYPGGQGLPRLSFYQWDYGVREDVTEWLAEQMRELLGFEIEVQQVSHPTLLKYIEEGVPHMYFLAWRTDYSDADSILRGANWPMRCNWSNSHFNQLLEEARTELNQTRRMALYKEAELILADDRPLVPLYYTRGRALIKPWVRRLPNSSMGNVMYKDVLIDDAPMKS